jgi:hypothetical protein
LPEIILPANGWRPRPYQRKLWDYFKTGGKRAIEIAHRRWGKDDIALHLACRQAHIKTRPTGICCPNTNRPARRSGTRSIRIPA